MADHQNPSSIPPARSPANANGNGNGNGNGKTPRRRPRKRILIPIVILLIAGVAGYLYWYKNLRGYVSTDDAFVEADQVQISSKTLGRIVQLNADEGDSVQKGELLVQLDDSDLRAQEAQAQAGAVAAEQAVEVARVNLDRAKDDLDRATVQIKDNVIPREQYDHARKAYDAAKAQADLANAQVKSAQAQLAVVQTQLRHTQIFAPSSGVVARRWALSGDVVSPGQPIFTVYDLQDVWVRANLEETKISRIKPGDEVSIEFDTYPGRQFSGRVELIGSAAAAQFSLIPPNNASGNFTKVTQRIPVKITLSEKPSSSDPLPLRPGMSATVKIRENR